MAVTRGSGLGGGGSSVSGAGVANRVTLWTGPATLGSDSGLAKQGTGNALILQVGDAFQGLTRRSLGVLGVTGGNDSYGHGQAGILEASAIAPAAPALTIHQTTFGTVTTIAVATQSTGLITCVAKANLLDGETVSVTDAVGGLFTYEFDLPPDGVGGGNVVVDVSAAVSAADVAAVLAPLITANNTDLTVVDNLDGTISLTAQTYGVAGSITLADTVADGGFAAVAVAGVDGILNNETLVADDGTNPATTFRFQVDGQAVGAGTPIPLNGGDTADLVRDGIISVLNGVGATLEITASNGGAATVDLKGLLDATPAALAETVVAGGFAVVGMAYRAATSNYSAAIVSYLEDLTYAVGATTALAGTAPDVLDADDYIELVWAHPTGSYYADVYRTVWNGGGATTGIIANNTTATTLDDTDIAAGGETLPAITNTTGRFVSTGAAAVAQTHTPIVAALSTAGANTDLFAFDVPAADDLASFEVEYAITYDDGGAQFAIANGVERITYWNSTQGGGLQGGVSGAFTVVDNNVITIGAVTWTVANVGTVCTVRVATTLVGVVGATPAHQIIATVRSLSTGTAEV